MSTGTIKQLLGIKKSVPLTLTAKVTDNGGPSSLSDRVHITVNRGLPCPPTNFPPVLRTISPPNNSVFRAAINLSVYAYAADKDGFVTGVEFFAGTNNLGAGRQVTPPSQCSGSAVPILALCAWLLWVPNADALGFRIPNQDASAIGRGNAFVATADNPSAIYYNPAGITQLEGQHIQAGSLFYLGIYGDYESTTGTGVHNNPEVIAAPTLPYTSHPRACHCHSVLEFMSRSGLV